MAGADLMTIITTVEELDALPDGVLLEASGTYPGGGTFTECWVRPIPAVITEMWGDGDEGRTWEVLAFAHPIDGRLITTDCIKSARVLYRPDQPASAAPTVKQQIESAVLAMYPTCHPSVESIEDLIWEHTRFICDGCWLDSRKAAEDIQGLYDRQRSEVAREAAEQAWNAGVEAAHQAHPTEAKWQTLQHNPYRKPKPSEPFDLDAKLAADGLPPFPMIRKEDRND